MNHSKKIPVHSLKYQIMSINYRILNMNNTYGSKLYGQEKQGKQPILIDRKLSVAPMMDWTDRFQRSFIRIITKHTLLYSEMITSAAVVNGNQQKLLGFGNHEMPVACQLGGSNPNQLAEAAKIVENFGYCEVNLNIGCPSDRVQSGRFGACLMAQPDLVAQCLSAMQNAVSIPVTIKSRIGIDDQDSYQSLHNFIKIISDAGCQTFIIHARKAILKGLSPNENRMIPPLKYDFVHTIKKDFPEFEIIINGGIQNLDEAITQLEKTDGVMIGRAAYQNPYILANADMDIFNDKQAIVKSRHQILREFMPYVEKEIRDNKTQLKHITRHILGIFAGQAGGKQFRRYLSESSYHSDADHKILMQAIKLVEET